MGETDTRSSATTDANAPHRRMGMNDDRLLAFAQITLSAIYMVGTFAVILIYELGLAHMSSEQDKSFGSFANFLTGGALVILYFWFQRMRAGGIPAPTTTTTTETTPNATTTTTVQPSAAVPAAGP
jgi:hypothetical protein